MKSSFIVLIFVVFAPLQNKEHCKNLIQSGIDALNQQEHAKSLEILIEAQSMASSMSWNEELFYAFNNIGANYYQLSDYDEALKNYLKAYDIAVKLLDLKKEMVVINNVGILFFNDERFKEAKDYFLKAYSLALQHNETNKIGLYAVNLGLTLNLLGELDQAYDFLKISQENLNDSKIVLQLQYAIAENFYLKGDVSEAMNLLNTIIPELIRSRLFEHTSWSYLLLSKINQKKHDFKRSLEYALKAKNNLTSMESSIEIFEHISDIKYKMNKYSEARTYRDSVILFKDSLYDKRRNDQFESNRVKFDLKQYEKEILDKKYEINQDRKAFIVIIVLIALIGLILIWIWKVYSSKEKQRRIILERNQRIKMLQLENELELQNRKLTSKALGTASRNELLQEIIQTITSYPDLLNNSNIKKLVQQLKKYLNDNTGWQDFLFHFEKANYGFLKTIKERHPSLNTNDIRFICYLYMDLSIKEIASLFNITPDACRKRKQRVAKKLNLQDTSKIYDYLSSY